MHVDGGWFPSNPSFVVVSSRLVSSRVVDQWRSDPPILRVSHDIHRVGWVTQGGG